MNVEEILIECGALTLELLVTYFMYEAYKSKRNCLKSLQEVKCFQLDSKLQKGVEENGGVIKYAAISGSIKALAQPLRSQYVPHLRGVLRERITKEHKLKWSPFYRMWSSGVNYLLHSTQAVPFALYNKSGGLFEKQVAVEIMEPLKGSELVLPVVHDEFTSHQDTVGDAVFGFIRGERTVGIQEVEKMLCETDNLTAIGKLVLENNKLCLKPPDPGLTYFVTPHSLECLTDQVRANMQTYKVMTVILGTAGIALAAYVSRHVFLDFKKRLNRKKELQRLEEQRRLRRIADESRGLQNEHLPKCVVCLEFPVEILILECGHACLCYTCAENVNNLCPVCREPITRTVPAFWP